MPYGLRSHRSTTLPALISAATLALTLVTAPSARAETVTVAEMLRGISKTQSQCAATPQAVWIASAGHSYCMRYYMASVGEERRPIVFLQGDRLGVLNLKTGAFAVPEGERDINTDDLMRIAASLAREAKTTAIYLGRVGVEGSSGDHRVRHSILELHATNAALDAIKAQYHLDGFHLIGQSGGAHLVAGLLGLRNDIGCAVIGSGPLTPTRRMLPPSEPALEHFNPANYLAGMVRNRAARIMVVTDPSDKKVSADRQNSFVRMLRDAGRPVEQYQVQAIDENRHGVVVYSRVALSGCMRNESSEKIAQDVDRLVQQRVAQARPKNERRNDGSRDTPTTAGDAHGHGQPTAVGAAPNVRAPEATH